MTVQEPFRIVKQPEKRSESTVVFSILRDEIYFLPHFLAHYRGMGVEEFWFLNDGSVDGSREFLLDQADCGVLESPFTFTDRVDGKRFVVAMKDQVPRTLFSGRWVLTVDADEFLLLPQPHTTLSSVTAALQGKRLLAARALMFDFFPETLNEIQLADAADSPFKTSSYFTPFTTLDWPDVHSSPVKISVRDSVRPRIHDQLKQEGFDPVGPDYKIAALHKAPLVYWADGVQVVHSHACNVALSSDVQLALAHFKFYPGYLGKVEHALSNNCYWNQSSEYRIIDAAVTHLSGWDLRAPLSKKYESPASLESAGMMWFR